MYQPENFTDPEKLYGSITSDMQVRIPIRILCQQLVDAGMLMGDILRYRIAFRPACLDQFYVKEAGVVCSP